jgi:hypothetical protein
MEQTESQIAKIQLGNFKKTSSFVYCLAEKATASEAEIYAIAELPLLNPAALESCEQICLSLAGSLKRSYKKPLSEASFENAVAEVNEELGKLVSMGQTNWVEKLNAIIAVKEDTNLHIATTGKVSAYLFRNSEYTDISTSGNSTHPLKTFENFATGKIRLNDVVILSTNQLFNHLSMDRLKNILLEDAFLPASQKIIEIIKSNAGPEAAFASLLILQAHPGETPEEEIDLENYIIETPKASVNFFKNALLFLKQTFAMAKSKRKPATELPKIKLTDRLKRLGDSTKDALNKSHGAIGRTLSAGRRSISFGAFGEYSPWKKFLLVSVFLLFAAGVFNIYAATRTKQTKSTQETIANQLKDANQILENIDTLILYKDQQGAQTALEQVQSKIPQNENGLNSANKQLLNQTKDRLKQLESKIEKQTEISAVNIGNLGADSKLLKLGNYLATQVGSSIISFNLSSGAIQDGNLMSSESIISASYLKDQSALVYNGSALLLWDFEKKIFSQPFTLNVPQKENFAGMKYYQTNSRVYIIDKALSQITSFLTSPNISKPIAAVKNPSLAKALDIAIDSNIYVLTEENIFKFQSGKQAAFSFPFMIKKFSGQGKIYTEKDWNNIYVLDIGNNRVIILDKKGNLVSTLTNREFSKLKDFYVDEPSKTIYLLNDSSLLKANF